MSRIAPRWIGWLAASMIVLTGCPQNDKGDEIPPVEDPPVAECEYRDDPTPPAYTWTTDRYDVAPQTTIQYHIPSAPIGLVVLFDGGGGSGLWFATMEGRRLTEALVAADYAVVGLPSEDTDLTDDENPWDDTDSPTNVDIVNLRTSIGVLEAYGLPAGLPRYYVGFSKGGGFASFAIRFEPANALALYNVAGQESAFDVGTGPSDPPPPTLWMVGRNDAIVTPDDTELMVNVGNIAALGIDHDVLINEPISPHETAFARIADPSSQVSEADSEAAFDDLVNLGYIEYVGDAGCPFLTGAAADLDLTQVVLGPSFSPAGFAEEAKRQIDELHGGHQLTSDFTSEIVSLFDSNP